MEFLKKYFPRNRGGGSAIYGWKPLEVEHSSLVGNLPIDELARVCGVGFVLI